MASLFFFTIRQLLGDAKFWGVGGVLLLPSVLVVVIRRFAPPFDGLTTIWELYHGMLLFVFFMGLVPLSCMIYGTALIGSEVEARTIGYLITRRPRRSAVLLTRFFATALAISMIAAAAAGVFHVALFSGMDLSALKPGTAIAAGWEPRCDLAVYVAAIPLAVVGFLSVFSVIGLLTPKPLALSVIYMVAVEIVLSNLPVDARAYSLTHQLRATVAADIPNIARLLELPPQLAARYFPPGGSGLWEALLATAAALLVSCVLVTIRELTPSKVARD